MHKRIIGFAIGLAVLGAGALIFFNFFEIVENKKYISPSREARINEYLALDRLLVSSGYSIRIENPGTLEIFTDAPQTVIFIQSDLVKWDEKIIDSLAVWTKNGGRLILGLSLFRNWDEEDPLVRFLYSLGLVHGEEPEDGTYRYTYDIECPSYGRNVFFNNPEEAVLVLKDENDLVRLAEFNYGNGKIIVTGRTRFMNSYNINREANARLSWYLFSGDSGPGSVLFIRGTLRAEGMMGRFFERGNFVIIIIAFVILVAVGFWNAIPVFGVVKSGAEKKGKILAERFLAEGYFLKRFNSLDVYRSVYLREIKRKLIKKENPDDEVLMRAAAIFGNGSRGTAAVAKAAETGRQKINEFPKSIIVLKTILERL